jgi:hypothetical protein
VEEWRREDEDKLVSSNESTLALTHQTKLFAHREQMDGRSVCVCVCVCRDELYVGLARTVYGYIRHIYTRRINMAVYLLKPPYLYPYPYKWVYTGPYIYGV